MKDSNDYLQFNIDRFAKGKMLLLADVRILPCEKHKSRTSWQIFVYLFV